MNYNDIDLIVKIDYYYIEQFDLAEGVVSVGYTKGAKVVYPLHGVGIISSIEDKTVLGEKRSYYIIKLAISDMTVMIPTHRSEELGLRLVVTSKDVKEALRIIEEDTADIDEDWKTRYQNNFEKIKSGSIFDVAEVVRNLFHRNRVKELSIMEKKLYENAYRLLVDEISIVKDMKKEAVQDIVAERLLKSAS
ncbi:MAG: transcriptional regulator [Spirochaetota bacterium]|nr:MAG: transcriptional regulator [Spirochaetota bacterium]